MADCSIRPTTPADIPWIKAWLNQDWGSERMVARGEIFYPADHAGFAAFLADKPAGLLTYRIVDRDCEITLLDSFQEGIGIGTALIEAVRQMAAEAGCRRLWLITTNDNLNALGFYQKRSFTLAALYPNAIQHSRELKPEIPLIGANNIPLRDEIEFEMLLEA
ncbi:MAG: GNAT family N-acetyltransferase [Anaerolineales bacterium]|nr:GNAT family N-acetyltransferase [Anaerolineales bacterium]